MKKVLVATVIAGMLAGGAMADEIIFDVASIHLPDRNQNNINPGIGYKFDLGDGYGITVGTYYNSFKKETFYVGGEKLWDIGSGFASGVTAGIMTGYDYRISRKIGVTPAVGIVAEQKLNDQIAMTIIFSDDRAIIEHGSTVLHTQIRYQF